MDESRSFEMCDFEPRYAEGVRELARAILCDEYGVQEDLSGEADLQDISAAYAPPANRLLVVVEQGRVIASCGIRHIEGSVCELSRLYVQQGRRRQGFASMMFAELINFVHERKYKTIHLQIRPEMEPDTDVYRRYGFQELPEGEPAPRPGHFMTIRLP